MNVSIDNFRQFHQHMTMMLMQYKSCLYADLKTGDDFILSQIPDDAMIIDERDFKSVFDLIDAHVYANKEYDANNVYLIQEIGIMPDGSEFHISSMSKAEPLSSKYPDRCITLKDLAEYPHELSEYSKKTRKICR